MGRGCSSGAPACGLQQGPQRPELIGAGQFKRNRFAGNRARVFLSVLIQRLLVKPVGKSGPPILGQVAQQFGKQPPVREEAAFQRQCRGGGAGSFGVMTDLLVLDSNADAVDCVPFARRNSIPDMKRC